MRSDDTVKRPPVVALPAPRGSAADDDKEVLHSVVRRRLTDGSVTSDPAEADDLARYVELC